MAGARRRPDVRLPRTGPRGRRTQAADLRTAGPGGPLPTLRSSYPAPAQGLDQPAQGEAVGGLARRPHGRRWRASGRADAPRPRRAPSTSPSGSAPIRSKRRPPRQRWRARRAPRPRRGGERRRRTPPRGKGERDLAPKGGAPAAGGWRDLGPSTHLRGTRPAACGTRVRPFPTPRVRPRGAKAAHAAKIPHGTPRRPLGRQPPGWPASGAAGCAGCAG